MGLLDTFLSAGEGGMVNRLASQFGIGEDQATSALKIMGPALAAGIQEKLSSGGSSALSNLLCSGTLTKFAENPATVTTPAGIEQGKSTKFYFWKPGPDASHFHDHREDRPQRQYCWEHATRGGDV